jgi:hypothetical protein
LGGNLPDIGLHGGPDVLHGDVDVVSLSPVTIASFVAAFGAFGLIGTGLFDTSPAGSLAWATVGGLLVGIATHLAFVYFFVKPQGSSEVTRSDLVGAKAEVTASIPDGRVGEVAVVAQGARFLMTARAANGLTIARGTLVTVRDVVGGVAHVVPIEPPADPTSQPTA